MVGTLGPMIVIWMTLATVVWLIVASAVAMVLGAAIHLRDHEPGNRTSLHRVDLTHSNAS